MDDILAGQQIIGFKEDLESKYSEHKLGEANAFNELVRLYESDTVNAWAHDSLIDLLRNHHTISAKYILAFELLDMGEPLTALETLQDIPTTFNLNHVEQLQQQNYLTYFNVLKDLKGNGLTIFGINNDQKSVLSDLANNAEDPVQSYARNILLANNLISYDEPIILPDETQTKAAKQIKSPVGFVESGDMKIFPNPANKYVIIEYNLNGKGTIEEKIILSITTGDGKIVEQKILQKVQNQVLIDCSSLKSGVYLCRITLGKKTAGIGKFTIVR